MKMLLRYDELGCNEFEEFQLIKDDHPKKSKEFHLRSLDESIKGREEEYEEAIDLHRTYGES